MATKIVKLFNKYFPFSIVGFRYLITTSIPNPQFWNVTDRGVESPDIVNKADIKAGDTVRFKYGGQWRDQLIPKSGKEGKPVVYTSYGDGVKPRFRGRVPLDKMADWFEGEECSNIG